MKRGFAGTVAVPAWARFMKKATDGLAPDWFEVPSDVERISVCRTTGMRASRECRSVVLEDGRSNVYEDYYLTGTGPYETCVGAHIHDAGLTPAPDRESDPLPTTAPSAVF
jgi:membrane carboxypeptidase/penicillin-binding protein